MNNQDLKNETTRNWDCPENELNGFSIDLVQTKHISFSLIGPYGFRAELFQDSIIFEHNTRWREFNDNLSCQERFIKTIKVFAKALSSKQAYFLPDSYYPGSGCVEVLSDEGSFNDVLDCLRVSGANLVSLNQQLFDDNLQIYILCEPVNCSNRDLI